MNGKALTGELLDVYDIDGRRTGRTIERKNCFDNIDYESERLLLVHACIFNSRGQMLLQRRQLTKDRYPGLWDVSAGGFVSSGEEPDGAVKRELREELGLDSGIPEPVFVWREPFGPVLDDFYEVRMELDPAELKLQEEELMAAAWFSRGEVLEMLHKGTLVDYPEKLLERMFENNRKSI